MSKTKIQWHEASRVADRIADKAFEHLLKPFVEEEQRLMGRAYDKVISTLDVPLLLRHKLLKETEHVQIQNAATEDIIGTLEAVEGGTKLLCNNVYYDRLVIDDAADIEALEALSARKHPVQQARNALYEELRRQIEGKSAKHVMKTWPEAAPLVADYFCMDPATGADTSMVTPLETLLSKYLTPLLAAPQPELERI